MSQHRIISLDNFTESLGSLALYHNTNDNEHTERIKRVISLVIRNELTEKQRQVLLMYYFDNKNIIEISKELGINKSSVSRLISRAKMRIEKALKYNFKY